MGVKRLPHVVARLVAHGRDPQTPAAIVERGTLAGERVVTGILGDIAERAALAGICSPATLVIGDVVRLRESLFSSALAPSIPDRQPSTLSDRQSAIS
jgi:siroheme synthase